MLSILYAQTLVLTSYPGLFADVLARLDLTPDEVLEELRWGAAWMRHYGLWGLSC